MPVRRVLVPLVLSGAWLGACSGSDEGDATVSTSVALSDAPAPTIATTTPTTAPPRTVAPTTVPPTTPPPTVPPTTDPPSGYDDWCGLAVAVDAVTAERDEIDFTDPVAVESYVEPLAALMEQAVPLAPAPIADDVALAAGNTLALYDALSANDFDVLTLDLSATGVVEDGADEASEAIEAYNEATCGIPRDGDGDGDDGAGAGAGAGDGDGEDVDIGTGSLRDLFVGRLVAVGFDPAEADCLFGELDFGDPDAITDDAVEEAFGACGIDPLRIDELSAVLGG